MSGLAPFVLALRTLRRRPGRTLLAAQGIVWGVAISLVPAAVLAGSRDRAREQAAEMGTDRIAIRAQTEAGGRPLGLDDAAALRDRWEPMLRGFAVYRVRFVHAHVEDGDRVPVDVIGADGDVLEARAQRIDRGRSFTDEERERRGARVAMLEPGAAAALFGHADPVGRTVTLGRLGAFEVVGVIAPRSEVARTTDDLGFSRDHPLAKLVRDGLESWGLRAVDDDWKRADRGVIVPRARAAAPAAIEWIVMRLADPEKVGAEAREMERFLVTRGCDVQVLHNAVWPILGSDGIEALTSLNRALSIACLAMSAVVIANLTLLFALERRHEIGVRRTEGATRGDVVVQLLVEALGLGVVGSLAGVPLGLGLAWIRVAFAPWSIATVSMPWGAAAFSVSIALASTVIAAALPALRASRADPVEVLRCGAS